MADHHEIERTFAPAAVDAVVPDVLGVAGIAVVGKPRAARLTAEYYDTAAHDLLRAGITLRRRTGGSDAGWHLKVPRGRGRDEVQLPLSRARRMPPQPLRDAVLGSSRGAALVRVATIVTERTMLDLHDADGVRLAELADDVVVGTPLVAGAALEPVRWREWEVELVEGGVSVLDAIGSELERAGAVLDESGVKLARVIGAPAPAHAPLPPATKGAPAALVLHAWIAEQVSQIARRDFEIRRGGDGLGAGVHKARVACRRLRGSLATYRLLVDREVTDPIREELRWLAHVLGPARDLDVAHERLRGLVDEEPSAMVLGPVRQRINDTYRVRQREARESALESLRSERYFALRERLDRLVAAPPWTDVAGEPAEEVLPKRVRKELRRVEERVAVAQESDGDGHDEAVHAARRAAKRLRYAAEVLEPVWGSDAKRLAKAAKKFAATLGTRQDAVVTGADLMELAAAAEAVGESGFTYGRLHAREGRVAEEIDAGLAELSAKLSRSKLRRWL